MLLGQVNFGPFELESLRLFGAPSLSNLIEIPMVAILGMVAATVLLMCRRRGRLGSPRAMARYVLGVFAAAVVLYFLMPTLPE
jgi:hypothetical protein